MSESSFIEREAARLAAETLPGIPRDANGPVFRAPWEAHAFAMALALYERGLFAWGEWARMLGEEIKKAQAAGDPDTGDTYYHHCSRRSNAWSRQKARPRRKRLSSITKPGNARCTERLMANPLS
jgi:nitrile hydratase accessory protein